MIVSTAVDGLPRTTGPVGLDRARLTVCVDPATPLFNRPMLTVLVTASVVLVGFFAAKVTMLETVALFNPATAVPSLVKKPTEAVASVLPEKMTVMSALLWDAATV